MQHTKDINFPQIETTRFFPQNSHTQTKLQTYEFIILGVKPRHLLFQEKKKPYPYPGHSDLQLTMPVSPVTISRVMGLRVLFSNCPPSWHQFSAKEAYQLPSGPPQTTTLVTTLVTTWIFLMCNSESNWYERGISHSGQNIMGRGWFWCHKFPSSSHLPQTLPEGPREDL